MRRARSTAGRLSLLLAAAACAADGGLDSAFSSDGVAWAQRGDSWDGFTIRLQSDLIFTDGLD